jgi:hypothetical protein
MFGCRGGRRGLFSVRGVGGACFGYAVSDEIDWAS